MLARQYTEHYSIDDYQHWEGEWELIGGIPYAMSPSPMVTHQSINMKISRQLSELLDDCPQCQALFEIDWEVSSDTVVKPDTIVICYEPQEKITKKPEIIFEIASKATIKRDETVKYDLYQEEGVHYYIIVYPQSNKAKVYQLREGKYIKVGDFSDESYSFDLNKCSLDFDFSRIWRVRG